MSGDKRILFLCRQSRPTAHAVVDDPAYEGWKLTATPPAKTRDQEERYHAMIGDIARQYPIHGKLIRAEDMKRVMVSAFKIDTKDDPDLRPCWQAVGEIAVLPGLRGEFVVLGDQTRRFPKKLASAFIEWLFAEGALMGIVWSDPKEARPEMQEVEA